LALVSLGPGPTVRLLDAVKASDITAVRALLKHRTDVNIRDGDGTTALHWAVDQDDVDIVKLLIAAGADVSAANRYGVQPISLACANGSPQVVGALLEAGANPNFTSSGGETALMTAARASNAEAVKALLSHGAAVNARESTSQQTALMWAAAGGDVATIRALIDGGANIHARSSERDAKDVKGGSIANGYVGDFKHPAELTPLLFAVRNGHIDAVKALVEAGANVNDASSDGTSALLIAAINAHWELGIYLLDRGADPNSAASGWSALHQVARTRTLSRLQVPFPIATGRMTALDLVASLILHGANVNARMTAPFRDGYRYHVNWVGATPFFVAAKGADPEMMRLLLVRGADPNLTNASHTTALMVAAGIDVWSIGEDIWTVENAAEAVKLCLAQAGVEVNAVNDSGETALHGAAHLGLNEAIEVLVERGAKLNAKNKKGETPYMYAAGRDAAGRLLFLGGQNQPETAKLLRDLLTARGMPVDNLPPAYQ
jgi:ankyrin repeat protein